MSRHMSCPPARAMWMALLCCSFTSLERPLLAGIADSSHVAALRPQVKKEAGTIVQSAATRCQPIPEVPAAWPMSLRPRASGRQAQPQ